jgi:GNAT superfamily N-acetyltransferase
MASNLRKVPFTKELLPAVEDFECGGQVYEVEVSDWIQNKGPGCVIDAMERWGTQVWLYVNEQNELVGFGSLGKTKWNWPDSSDNRVAVNLIPSVGLRSRFRGQPDGPPEERYSTLIVLDLIAEARRITDVNPVLGLFLHPDNQVAMRFYKRLGFADFHQRSKGDDPGIQYIGMILRLDQRPALAVC